MASSSSFSNSSLSPSTSSSSATSPPAKSQFLQNFALPAAPWNRSENPSGRNKRSRSIKSPPRTNAASRSPVRRSPIHHSVAAPLSRLQPPPSPSPRRFQSPRREYSPPQSRFQSSRCESYYSSPASRFQSLRRDFSTPRWFPSLIPEPAAPAQRDTFRVSKEAASRLQPEPRRELAPAIDDELERNLLRQTKGKSPAIAYTRNPTRRSGFPSATTPSVEIQSKSGIEEIVTQIKSRAHDENPRITQSKKTEFSCTKVQQTCTNSRKVEEEVKVWNLRPRDKIRRQPEMINKPVAAEKKVKKRLSIEVCLTKQEIEDDIFVFTGAKPSRRPKKHPKIVQKQLDILFPGLNLQAIDSDTYK